MKLMQTVSRRKKNIDSIQENYLDTEIIATNGNRYDVNLHNRQRTPVYWEEASNEVRRSKWFYLPESENRFIPYDEKMNDILEVVQFISKFSLHIVVLLDFIRRNMSKTNMASKTFDE